MPLSLSLPSLDSLNWTVALLGIGAVVVGILRSEFVRLWAQVPGALVGRGEKKDRSGRVTREAEPGLLSRTAAVEEAVTTLVADREDTKELRQQIADLGGRLDTVENTVGAILADKWEKGSEAQLEAAKHALRRDDITVDPTD